MTSTLPLNAMQMTAATAPSSKTAPAAASNTSATGSFEEAIARLPHTRDSAPQQQNPNADANKLAAAIQQHGVQQQGSMPAGMAQQSAAFQSVIQQNSGAANWLSLLGSALGELQVLDEELESAGGDAVPEAAMLQILQTETPAAPVNGLQNPATALPASEPTAANGSSARADLLQATAKAGGNDAQLNTLPADATSKGADSASQAALTATSATQTEVANMASSASASASDAFSSLSATGTASALGANSTPLSAANNAAQAQTARMAAQLNAPLASAQWSQDLGQQLVSISRRGEQRMALNLNPADLGPLMIDLKVTDQVAQLQFLSHHPQVRQAVEQAIPQLREALAEQGISLGETSVGEQQFREQLASQGESGSGASGNGHDDANDGIESTAAAPVTESSLPDGRINLYV